MHTARLLFLLLPALPLAAAQPATTLERVVVTTTRGAQPLANSPLAVDLFAASDLQASPALALDDTLRSSAAFSLFRRSGSLTANPTAQGVSLRGLGPSGASRSLVLLDGIPLNDPFGGWVSWTKLPRASLARVELVRGGGSGAWGNAALGGTIQLLSRPLETDATAVTALVGDYGTRAGEVSATRTTGDGAVHVAARAFATDGFFLVEPERRGAIDRRADSRHHWAQASWRQALAGDTRLQVNLRTFDERRGNGTPLQGNRTRETLLSAGLEGSPAGGPAWTAAAYFQDQAFASFFSAVSADRSTETPASDQFDVPARAAGAAVTATWIHAGDARTTAGADARWVEGETRERFFLADGAFTRQRIAGGEQAFAGAFVQHERALAPGWRANLGARLDAWRNTNGSRRETDLINGAVLRDDAYADTDGVEFSPTAGVVWRPRPGLRARAAAYRAFRVPTLNELHRPFRVGNVITEANPALAVETLTGVEAGLELTFAAGSLSLAAFQNDLDDAVANVTLGRGPGVVPGVGFVPAGGSGRQRRNLDAVRVRGLEVSAGWTPRADLRFTADYLLSDARVRRAAPPAEIAGKRLAQVPRHTLVVGTIWQAPGQVSVNARIRWTSAQFEDDENALRLAPAATVDLGLSRAFGDRWTVFASVENLFDERVETGRSGDGLVNIAPPRFAHAGVRWAW
jgi:outer membrane receptor protein involved in Fe transport